MTDREQNRRENDVRQGAEGDLPPGEDERQFGAGGQKVIRPLDKKEKQSRDADRDSAIPDEERPLIHGGETR